MVIQVSKLEKTENKTLVFTDEAAKKVQALMDEEKNPNFKLRVFVAGGGCAGFQYGFTFDENVNAADTVIEKKVKLDGQQKTVVLLVDPISIQYLSMAEIDYKEDLNGAQFVIRNPNVRTTCSCGGSFAMDDASFEEGKEGCAQ
ncbi:MAG: iron-sulfur cluster insertion protein ErpA [Pseudomonadota bacterium]